MRIVVLLTLLLSGVRASAQVADTAVQPKLHLMFREPRPLVPAAQVSLAVPFQVAAMPFFCRQEYRLEKQTKIPLRLRVGNQNQCDFLEGKGITAGVAPNR